MVDVVIVGAGLSGLCAARRLVEQGRSVVVVDKGRGVGGRMATRRLDAEGTAVADHGAQFFTVRRPEFRAMISDWPVEVWHHGPARAHTIEADPGTAEPGTDGHPRFMARGGMTAIAKHLAADLDVRTGVRVQLVSPSRDGGWLVESDGDAPALVAPTVIVTSPVPQTVEMVQVPLPSDVVDLAYDPTLALLAVLEGPAGLPVPGAVEFADGPVHWLADNQVKGIADRPTVTIHAKGPWSRDHFDDDDDRIKTALSDLAQPWLRGSIIQAQVKRWRYAQPTSPHPHRVVIAAPGLLLAGDVFGGPKMEGAALSGLAAADAALPGPDAAPA